MALIPMQHEGEWIVSTLTPQSGYSAVSNYGTMRIISNKVLGLAQIIWSGNSTVAVAGNYRFTLPNDLLPKWTFAIPLKDGSFMEVRSDNFVSLQLTNTSWSGGSITYALNQ